MSTERQSEIIDEIVGELEPLKPGCTKAAATAEVKHQLNVLLKQIPWQREISNLKRDPVYFRRLDRALSKVQKLLKSAPGLAGDILRSPKFGNRSDIEGLGRLREVCGQMKSGQASYRPSYDTPAQRLCAHFAHSLMQRLSANKITGTEGDAFRIIAEKLYEAISGKVGADLKRACDAVLKDERR
jgi:hypothetical protein